MGTSYLDRLEHYRHQYALLRQGWEPATARYQRSVAASIASNSRLLDLGCGRGGIVERLGVAGYWMGTDPDLRSLVEHRRPELPRCCAQSQHLPFATATFDIVVASWVLEHMLDPQQTFREISRVLRPGGSFFFLTPNAAHPVSRLSKTLAKLHPLQQRIVTRVYGRQPSDTFPAAYRANTATAIQRLGTGADMRLASMEWIEDPSYLAWEPLTFFAAICLDMVLPGRWRVHLVGELTKV